MTPVVHTDISTKKILPQKGFLLVNLLHVHLINRIRNRTFFFLIVHFKHVLREVGRKVVTEPVFSMDRGVKA